MPIYTKTGDKGETALFGGKRLSKVDMQVEAYGSVDELGSFLGLLIAKLPKNEDRTFLTEIQADLYKIMAFLAGANSPIELLVERTAFFEQKIDSMQSQLPELHSFILPIGTEISALSHIVRTTCRRSERAVVRLSKSPEISLQKDSLAICLKYLNRLSDLFFVLARWYNQDAELKISLTKKMP